MNSPQHLLPLLTVFSRAVLQASWEGSLAIVLVLIVRGALGARVPARWHYLLWFLVLARLLVPAVVLPHSPASLENIPAVARPFGRQPPQAATRAIPARYPQVAKPELDELPRATKPAGFLAPSPAIVRHPWSWPELAAVAWLLGAAILGGWLVVCSLRLGKRVRRETAAAHPAIVAVWESCCEKWLRRSAPRVLMGDWVHSPALLGLWRPVLLLPRQLPAAFSAQDWEHVFAHEIAHLRWRDHWSQLLVHLAWCAHWFNPVVWIGLRRLRADRELAADEWALRHLASERSLAYGETLYKTVASRPAGSSFQPGLVGISEDGAQMKQRLQRITAFLPRRHLYGSLAGLAALLVLASVVLGQSSPSPAASSAAPTPAPAPETGKPAEKPSPSPKPPSLESLAAAAQSLSDRMLAAARAGDGQKVANLMDVAMNSRPPTFSSDEATRMLDDLVRSRELPAFTVLHDQLVQSNYAKDWKISDPLLASLVKDGRTDFLDVLLARRLNLDRLSRLAETADPAITAWITRRVAEVAQQRSNIEALEVAASNSDLPAMQRLLDAGTDVNGVGKDDNTPLIRAVFKDRLDTAQFLLDHGALVDKPRFPGWDYTPLCLVNSVPMAELLKKNGANIHAKLWRRDVNILVYVAMFGKPEVVEWFFQQGLDPKMLGDNRQNLLFEVASARTAELLLKAGVDPNQVDTFGNTPICTAKNAEIAQLLVDHGAKVTGFDKPLLPRMIQFGSAGAIEVALKAGAPHDPEMLQAALITAAHMDRDGIAGVLIKYGANPNEPGIFSSPTDKMLPLEASCVWGGVKTARVLLAAGADPNGGKAFGLLETAMHNGYKELAELLRQTGAKGVSDLSFALATRDTDKVKALLASAPGYQENPAFWADVLPSAARLGDVATIREALKKGAPPELGRAVHNGDAYSAAALEGQDEALAVLLAARKPGDDPAQLRPALSEAVWNCHPYQTQRPVGHFETCVQMLLAAGAPIKEDPAHPEYNLITSAVFSRNPGGNAKVIEMLVRAGADPNPVVGTEGKSQAHLIDAVREACTQGYCSTPVADTIIKLNQIATQGASSSDAPTASPSPTARDSGPEAERPGAIAPVTSKGIVTTGRVSMADGTPLGSSQIIARVYSVQGHSDTMVGSEVAQNGSFSLRTFDDTVTATVAVEQPGCAAVFAGPFSGPDLDKLNGLRLQLTRGFAATVHVVDEAGRPIPGARLQSYYPGPPEMPCAESKSDPSGNALIEHIGEAPLNIRVLADGFQADEVTGLHLDPARPYRWTLKPAQPPPWNGSSVRDRNAYRRRHHQAGGRTRTTRPKLS